MTYKEYRKEVLKAHAKKNFKVTNSLGVYDCYKYLRKNKWFDIPRPLTEKEFYSIIRECNKLLQEDLFTVSNIIFPYNLGSIEFGRYEPLLEYRDGKIKNTYPINWKKTLQLWYEDLESRNNKTLVRNNNPIMFKVFYNKSKAIYNNKAFFEFTLCRQLKVRFAEVANNKEIDSYELARIKSKR